MKSMVWFSEQLKKLSVYRFSQDLKKI